MAPRRGSDCTKLGWLGVIALSAACGQGQRQIDTTMPTPVMQPILSLSPPASYTLADAECQKGPGLQQVTGSEIRAWLGPKTVAIAATLADTNSEQSLRDQAISGTTYADQYSRSCDYSLGASRACADASGREKYWQESGSGGALRICKDRFAYPRLSYEAVALTSLYHIQKARERYLSVVAATSATAPAPVRLSILAEFITDTANFPIKDATGAKSGTVRSYVTDNLAYFPDAQMITVFPARKNEAQAMPGFFWESAFVLGHEYGHHIDYTRHGQVLTSVGLTWNPVAHGFSDALSESTFGNNSSERARAAGAMAEAFADLLGFYSSGADGSSITGLPYIGRDRNVLNATFRSGSQKILTTERALALLGRQSSTAGARGSVDSVDFGDIHAAGAVIAHVVDLVFGELLVADPALTPRSTEETNQRYDLTLKFMDALTQGLAKLRPDADGDSEDFTVLEPLTQALTEVSSAYLMTNAPSSTSVGTTDAIKKAVCQVALTQLPALKSPPFAKDDHC